MNKVHGGVFVECPICQAQVLEQDINSHIDATHVEAISDNHIDLPNFEEDLSAEPNTKRQRTSCPNVHEEACEQLPMAKQLLMANLLDADGQTIASDIQMATDSVDHGCATTVACDSSVSMTLVQDSNFAPQKKPQASQASSSLHTSWDNRPGASTTMSGKTCQPAVEVLQPDEHLRAHLLGTRAQALRDARNISANMHAKALQLCGEIEQDVEQKRRFFEDYPKMAKPTNYEAQCSRNRARNELQKVTRTALCNLQALMDTSRKPAETLCASKSAQLQKIDTVMHMLEEMRAETLSMFHEFEEEQKAARPAVEAATLAVAPSLDCLDCFLRHLTQEIDEETKKAIQVHTEKLQKLQQEQASFVTANDSPRGNPIFKKVIEDMECTERVLGEHCSASTSHKSLVKAWEEVMEDLPKKALQPEPQKSTVWGRLLGRA